MGTKDIVQIFTKGFDEKSLSLYNILRKLRLYFLYNFHISKKGVEALSKYQLLDKRVPIAEDNISIVYHEDKCKNCTLCRRACADVMSILDYYDLASTGDVPICIHCGQCAAACPFGALEERSEIDAVKRAVKDPEAIVIVQTAPAVRVGIGEEFGMDPGSLAEGKMVMALRKLGFDYVVDTNFGADMTMKKKQRN